MSSVFGGRALRLGLAAGLAALLLAPTAPRPADAADGPLEIEGFLGRTVSAKRIERKVLKSAGKGRTSYRLLTGMYVLRAPSRAAWDEVIAPRLKEAEESDKPIENLRRTMLGLGDALIAGPDAAGVRIAYDLPAERGKGFASLVVPPVIGPNPDLLNQREPNKMRVVTGVAVQPAGRGDDPVIESIGLKSKPDSWTEGKVRLPKLNPIPDDGEGAWVKYKGRSATSGEDMAKAMEAVDRQLSRELIKAERMPVWPGSSGDREGIKDLLRTARYRTRVLDAGEDGVVRALAYDGGKWDWNDKRVKHPTRYTIATLPVLAELDQGEGLEEHAEIFAVVLFYTSLFVDFDSAHLYTGTSPEYFAEAVQTGQVPFFDRDGKPIFYLGHLDRWVLGEGLKGEGKSYSRRELPERVERWASREDGRTQRDLMGLGRNPSHWPYRFKERDDDSGRVARRVVYDTDFAVWIRRFLSSWRSDDDLPSASWMLQWTGEAVGVHVGEILKGGTVELDLDEEALAVAGPEKDDGASQRRADEEKRLAAERKAKEAELSSKERARLEAERKKQEEERKKEEEARKVEEQKRAEAKKREDERAKKEEQERERQRAAAEAQKKAPIDIKLRRVAVGTPAEGKPYLATRAGRTLPVKVGYSVDGEVAGHTIQVVAQAFDEDGKELTDFVAKSKAVAPTAGDGSMTTYVKVPSSYTKPEHLKSYILQTRLLLDGVPVRGLREERVHLGKPITVQRAELDPAVFFPGDETVLQLDLGVGGWSVDDDVELQVEISYAVGDTKADDSFPMTRTVGEHKIEVDLDVPGELAAGEGKYTIRVKAPSGDSASTTGNFRVLSREVAAAPPTGGRSGGRGERERFDDDEDDELLEAARKAKRDDDDERDVIRVNDEEDDEVGDLFADDEDIDLDEDDEDERPAAKKKQGPKKQTKSRAEEREADEEPEEDIDLDDAAGINYDELPENVFFSDEEEEAMLTAEAEGLGVVKVYGSAEDGLDRWMAAHDKIVEGGGRDWLFLLMETKGPGLLRFSRWSTKSRAWIDVWETPTRWKKEDRAAAMKMMHAVFDGFVPDKKKKVPWNKL